MGYRPVPQSMDEDKVQRDAEKARYDARPAVVVIECGVPELVERVYIDVDGTLKMVIFTEEACRHTSLSVVELQRWIVVLEEARTSTRKPSIAAKREVQLANAHEALAQVTGGEKTPVFQLKCVESTADYEKEIGRREFTDAQSALTWLQDKAKKETAKGNLALMGQKLEELVSLTVLDKSGVVRLYNVAD